MSDQSVVKMFINPLEQVVALFAPHSCAICKSENYMLCPRCAHTNLALPLSRCYLCNKLTTAHQVCATCRRTSRLSRVWWLGDYQGTIKELIRGMKYQRYRAYAREFGSHMAGLLPYLDEKTVVVPVPTASRRIRQRGYDQAVLIARQFAHERTLQLGLYLNRTTQVDQIGKRRDERFSQMLQSLRIHARANSLEDAHILLIDDVLTTGATLETAARLLKSYGAKRVDAAVIARHFVR